MIVIPAIDLRAGRCVRLTRGDPNLQTEYSDDPVAVARRFEAEGAELLHVVDLDAALGTGSNGDTIATICIAVSIPVQVGGGLRSDEAISAALRSGVARAVVGTAAATDPSFVGRQVERHGDRIVVAVDVRDGHAMIRGWQDPGPELESILRDLDATGASRYLVTAIAADGRLAGPDLDLYRRVLVLTDRSVLAGGGIASTGDLKALSALGVEGVVVGKALYEGNLSLPEALEATRS